MKLDIEVFGTHCAGHCYILSELICLQRPRNLKILCRVALFLFASIQIQVFECYQSHSLLAKLLKSLCFYFKNCCLCLLSFL